LDPLIALWYFIWQWLQPKHTLEAVVIDARRGGATLCAKAKPLSKASNPKPPRLLRCSPTLAAGVGGAMLQQDRRRFAPFGNWRSQDLPSSCWMAPPSGFVPMATSANSSPPIGPAARNLLVRGAVLVSFCAATGIATARAWPPFMSANKLWPCNDPPGGQAAALYGDRNFGVWRVVRAAVQGGGHALVRLTQVRARALLGTKHLPAFLDLAVLWSPSSHDQLDPGLRKNRCPAAFSSSKRIGADFASNPVPLYDLNRRPCLPAQRLLELYGWRWQVD